MMKSLRDVIRMIESEGYVVDLLRYRKHPVLLIDGKITMTIPSTSSDFRSKRNTLSEIKRRLYRYEKKKKERVMIVRKMSRVSSHRRKTKRDKGEYEVMF